MLESLNAVCFSCVLRVGVREYPLVLSLSDEKDCDSRPCIVLDHEYLQQRLMHRYERFLVLKEAKALNVYSVLCIVAGVKDHYEM